MKLYAESRSVRVSGRFLRFSLLGLLIGCGSAVPSPSQIVHRADDFVEVPYPPPAALSETVADRPKQDAVWVDGEWIFQGRNYVWRRGGWMALGPGMKYAPWQLVYARDGRLMLAPGTWYASGRRIPRPKPIAQATTPPNEYTSELSRP